MILLLAALALAVAPALTLELAMAVAPALTLELAMAVAMSFAYLYIFIKICIKNLLVRKFI